MLSSWWLCRYPLDVAATGVEEVEVEFNPDFIVRMLPRIEFAALRHTAGQLGMGDVLPDDLPENPEENEELLRALHHLLLEVSRRSSVSCACGVMGTKKLLFLRRLLTDDCVR